jgi:integrase
MANQKVALLRYAKIPGLGWRRGRAVVGKTGKIKPDYMLIGKGKDNQEINAPEGHYQLRYFEGKQPRYKDVGNDPTEALAELARADRELKFKNSAEAVGYILPVLPQVKQKLLTEYGREFLELKRSPSLGLSSDAIDLYTNIVEEFVPGCGKTLPEDITEADVIHYCDVLDMRYADRTRATRYMSLRGLLFFCGLEPKRLITASVHKRLKSYEKKKIRIYSISEITGLLGICDLYHHVLFVVALLTGMRINELAHLLWRQVDFDANVIRLEHYDIVHKGKPISFKLKDGEARNIPLFPALRTELLRWRKERPDAVFVLGTCNDLPNVKILDALKRKARKAKLNCGLCPGCATRDECHRFHIHYFRSSFATYALTRNDIRKVQEWMGHADLDTLARYLGLGSSCPKWLSNLYVLPTSDSSEDCGELPPSIGLRDTLTQTVQ